MKKKGIVLASLIAGICLSVMFGERAAADEVAVDTIVELQDAVKNAPKNRRVTLSNSFPTDISATIGLVESAYEVEEIGRAHV